MARWQIDPEGNVIDAYVRRTPVVEYTFAELEFGESYPSILYRPLKNGEGDGDWKIILIGG